MTTIFFISEIIIFPNRLHSAGPGSTKPLPNNFSYLPFKFGQNSRSKSADPYHCSEEQSDQDLHSLLSIYKHPLTPKWTCPTLEAELANYLSGWGTDIIDKFGSIVHSSRQ